METTETTIRALNLVNRVVRALDQYIDAKFAMRTVGASAKRPTDPDDENSDQTATRRKLNRSRDELRAALTDLSVETSVTAVNMSRSEMLSLMIADGEGP